MTKQRILIPDYMDNFRCIGSACHDNCCYKWKIIINKSTFKKLMKMKGDNIPDFKNGLKRVRTNFSDDNYGEFIHVDDKCFFLDDNDLCNVHKQLGHEALPNVCASYPRRYNRSMNNIELSAKISCPVVAESLLPNKSGVNFIEKETELPSYMLTHHLYSFSNPNVSNNYILIRSTLIGLMQIQTLKLYERIILTGILLKRIDDSLRENSNANIPKIIDHYLMELGSQDTLIAINKIPSKIDVQIEWLSQIANIRLHLPITNERFSGYYDEFDKFISKINQNAQETYRDAYTSFDKAFKQANTHLFENYIVHSIFQENLYDEKKNSFMTSYYKIITFYNLIELMLIGIHETRGSLSESDAIAFMQTFDKSMDHNQAYVKAINNLIETENLESIAYVSILTKR